MTRKKKWFGRVLSMGHRIRKGDDSVWFEVVITEGDKDRTVVVAIANDRALHFAANLVDIANRNKREQGNAPFLKKETIDA